MKYAYLDIPEKSLVDLISWFGYTGQMLGAAVEKSSTPEQDERVEERRNEHERARLALLNRLDLLP